MEENNVIVTTSMKTSTKVIIASVIGAVITISIFIFSKLKKDD